MTRPKILIQLDSDSQPSVFDAVVAVDAGVDHLFRHYEVEPTNVRPLVHGAMFTRGPDELKNTAIFVGGSNVAVGDAIARELKQSFFGPMRVSTMLDGNGSNTTAVAAVLCAARHISLSETTAVVLGGTGPVGGRVARLLLHQGAEVRIVSRDLARATNACDGILEHCKPDAAERLSPVDTSGTGTLEAELEKATAVFGCGAAGIQLLGERQMAALSAKVAIDLNAVPPCGLFGIDVTDKAVERDGRIDYGAIGVGGLKMKIHNAAIRSLFTANDLFLDAEEIYEIGTKLEAERAAKLANG